MQKPEEKIEDRIVRFYDLAKAIERKISGKTSQYADSQKVAELVMGFFGYDNRIIDNILTDTERTVFSMLEEKGILKRYTEEYHGIFMFRFDRKREKEFKFQERSWRIFYWELNKREIFKLACESPQEKQPQDPYQKIFEHYPTSAERVELKARA